MRVRADAPITSWDTRADALPEAQQDQARRLLAQARDSLTAADQDANFLARMQTQVQTLDDGDRIEQRQNDREGASGKAES